MGAAHSELTSAARVPGRHELDLERAEQRRGDERARVRQVHDGGKLKPFAMGNSYVVTGGGRGVGRAIAGRLAADGGTVVIIEMDEAALDWVPGHPAAPRLSWV